MVNFVQPNINVNYSKNYNITNHYINNSLLHKTAPQNDLFFKGLSKPYNLSKAKKQEDIPDDANIFLFNCKNTVNLPEGRSAKECILSDKGFGFWSKFFNGEDGNKMLLKKNDVEYAHGDLTDDNRTCGIIEVDNSNVNQIDNVTNVRLKNNANVNFIDKVDEIDAFDSTMGDVSIKGAIHLNGNTKSDKLKAFTVVAYPGDKIGKVESTFLACKENLNKSNTFSEVDDAYAESGADITQGKIKKLKTKDLIFNNSLGGEIDAAYGIEFNNSAVDHLKLNCVKKMTGCKIKKFDLNNTSNELKFYDKVQIDELNLNNDESTFFIFPKQEWGEKTNNYIKTINIKTMPPYENPRPKLKIQGDIDIEKVVFHNSPGRLELTRAEDPDRKIKVINGYVKYNVPPDPVPDCDDLDL